MEKRCFGCMKIKHSSPVCEHCGYDERSQNEQERLPVGTVLRGRYQIGKALGQGGFGITYIGWDNLLDIAVAVKEYYPLGVVMRDCEISTKVHCYTNVRGEFDLSKQRFLREAKTLAKFMHIPEIVRVQDFFEENDTAYIVMEYVAGINIHQYMRRCGGSLSAEQTLNLLKPVMEALIQVHDANIVHRDISPDNIMILENGQTKLLDFGAVREVANPNAAGMLTRSTQTIMKRGFAPVEQYRSRGNLGPWTDVYALCATVYCCIMGRVPEESQELMLDGERIRWETVPGLSQRQKEALHKGTELLANNRTKSVRELYEGLYSAGSADSEKTEATAPVQPKTPLPEYHTAPVRQPGPQSMTIPLADQPEEKPAPQLYTAPVAHQGPTGPLPEEAQNLTVQNNYWQEQHTQPARPSEIPQDPEPEKKQNFLPVMAAILAVAVGVGVFLSRKQQPQMAVPETTAAMEKVEVPETTMADEIIETSETTEVTMATEPPVNLPENTLMERVITKDENGVIDSRNNAEWRNIPVFGTSVKPAEVRSITFWSDLAKAPVDAVDASYWKNGKVKAWTAKNGNLYDMHIAADGGVYAPENAEYLFAGMSENKEIRFNDSFFTENVHNMRGMFYESRLLYRIDVSHFDTANVTDMSYMFAMCVSLSQLDVKNFDTSDVTSMSHMFTVCSGLSSLDLSGFDTSNVRNMTRMFAKCEFRSLDLSNFNTSNVVNMREMFMNCYYLTSLKVNGWNTANVKDMSQMFDGCRHLKTLDLEKWNVGNDTNMFAMFNNSSISKPSWYKE